MLALRYTGSATVLITPIPAPSRLTGILIELVPVVNNFVEVAQIQPLRYGIHTELGITRIAGLQYGVHDGYNVGGRNILQR